MNRVIELRERDEEEVLVGRRRVARNEIATAIGEVLPHLFAWAGAHDVALEGRPFVRYLDAESDPLTLEPGMRIAHSGGEWDSHSDSLAAAGLAIERLPAGTVATTVHTGPYETLHEAYAALERWMAERGVRPAGAPWESYLTDPTVVADPREWRTEVCWPVR